MSSKAKKVRRALERLKRYGITITFGKNPLEGLRNKASWDICEALAALLNITDSHTDVNIGRIYTGDVQTYLAEAAEAAEADESGEPEEDALVARTLPDDYDFGDDDDDGLTCPR